MLLLVESFLSQTSVDTEQSSPMTVSSNTTMLLLLMILSAIISSNASMNSSVFSSICSYQRVFDVIFPTLASRISLCRSIKHVKKLREKTELSEFPATWLAIERKSRTVNRFPARDYKRQITTSAFSLAGVSARLR